MPDNQDQDQPKPGKVELALTAIFATQDGEVLEEYLSQALEAFSYHYTGVQTLPDVTYREGQREFARWMLELGGKRPNRDIYHNDPRYALPFFRGQLAPPQTQEQANAR